MRSQFGRWARGAAVASAAALAAACGGQSTPEGVKVLHRGNTGEPISLDPHLVQGTWENNIVGDMFMGLFTYDAAAEPIPGMAESWSVSEDGLTWTFTLREATWSDGVPVTADDFVFAFERLFDPETLSQYASLQYVIKGSEGVHMGAAQPQALGVAALDARTLEVTLEHPAAYLPELFSHYTAYPVPAHVVREHGNAWIRPENIEVNGAYKLVDWRTNDFVHVRKNEAFFDAENVCFDEVYYYPTTDQNAAARRVRGGELDLNTDFPGQSIDLLREQLPGYVRVYPFLTTDYLSFNLAQPPFDDVRVRKALAMAVDRRFIVDEILRAGQIPAYRFVPPGIAQYEEGGRAPWADIPPQERQAEARALLEEAGFGPDNPLRFEYTHRNTRENPRIAPVLQDNWRAIAPWVEVEIASIETQIHYQNLRARDFSVADGGWVADFNDPVNFLYLLETRAGPMNYAGYSNPAFDDLVRRSNRELDPDRRAALMREAEQAMLDDAPIAPMWHQVNKNLVHPRITGWVDNAVDIHRTRFLCDDGGEGVQSGLEDGDATAG